MRIAELYELRRFRMLDAPAPEPAPGEVQVRVKSVGICGSDLHYFSDGAIGDVIIKYPVVLGHEPTGEVVKTGVGVSGIEPGDRAMLEPAIYCYHCEFCRAGQHNVCAHMSFLSSPPDPGFFREFVNLPAHNLLPLPDGLGFDTGTLFEPLAVVLHSMQFAQIRLGETACVFGAGPIGLLTIAALKMAGAGRVWCVEPVSERRELARTMGADALIDPRTVDPVKQVLSDTGQRGVDVSIDCAAKERTVAQTIEVVRSAGRVVITGISSEPETLLNLHLLRRKEVALYNVRRSNHEAEAAVAMLRADPKRFAPLVTHRMPIDQAESAFEMLENCTNGSAKVVLRF